MASTVDIPAPPAHIPQQQAGPPASAPDPKRWKALVVILVAGFMDLLDATIVNVAVPSLQADLSASYAQLEWVVAGYALGFAAGLITGGRLGDIYGRKRIFLLGVAAFTAASTLCGVATTPEMLVGARLLQGLAAALMVPQILSIIHVTFPASERGKVFGLFGAIVGSASVAGPIVGGLLVEWDLLGLQWRPIFLVNIPVGIAVVVAAAFYLRESRSPTAPRLDLVGMAIAVTSVVLLVYPLTEGRRHGWPLWTFALMASSVVLFALFVGYERRRAATVGSPLIVLRLFRSRSFGAGLAVWLLFNIALGGFFLIWTLYMQIGLGWSPLHAGLTATLFALGAAPAAGASVQVLTPRFGRKVLMVGALLNAAGFAGYIWHTSHYGLDISSWQMVVPLVVAGIGFGLVVAPLIDLVLSDVPTEDAGSASGVFSTVQQLGMALGVAAIGVLFFTSLDTNSEQAATSVVPDVRAELTAAQVPAPAQDAIVRGFITCISDRSSSHDPTEIPASCSATSGGLAALGPETGPQVGQLLETSGLRANGTNFVHALGVSLAAAIAILVAVFAGMFALPRRVRVLDSPDGASSR